MGNASNTIRKPYTVKNGKLMVNTNNPYNNLF